MKIERINENQIRCTLTGEDLAKRQLKISELAYGTPKAKALFHDMMQQAAVELGFDAEHTPLMVEAVPLRSNGIVLIVTKVENPEELDTRFSNFSPSVREQVEANSSMPDLRGPNPFDPLIRSLNPPEPSTSSTDKMNEGSQFSLTNRLYSFHQVADAAKAARLAAGTYKGKSAFYEDHPSDQKESVYYLFLTMPDAETTAQIQMTLATFSEYGTSEWISPARKRYLENHCRVLCKEEAVSTLALL